MSDSKSRGSSNLYECELELRRGPWTLEEDNLLIHYISCHGEGRWNSLAKFAGLKRTGKSCRLRWLNYLKPDIKRGDLTPHEQLLILELHSKWGNKWSKIAQHLPGRTDNEIKNYWRTRVQKQARQLKVDSNSKTFIEAIRTFWMPRLFEQMEQNLKNHPLPSSYSSSSSISTVNPSISSVKTNSDSSNSAAQAVALSVDLTTGKTPTAETAYYDEGMGFTYDMQDWDGHDVSLPGRHVAGIDWFGDDYFSFSNTDELWQFKNL